MPEVFFPLKEKKNSSSDSILFLWIILARPDPIVLFVNVTDTKAPSTKTWAL